MGDQQRKSVRKIVAWNPYPTKSIDGDDIIIRGHTDDLTILEKIKNMPKGKPVKAAEALHISGMEFGRLAFEVSDAKRAAWVLDNWVEYISSLGMHIVLDGSEYIVIDEPVESFLATE